MGTVYWPIFIKIVDVLEWARHGLALSVLWSIGQLGRNRKIHCVGSISTDCLGSLLAFLQRCGEECLYRVGSTWHNSPLRQMNVRQRRKLFRCRALCALGSGACRNCQDFGSASQEATELQSSYVPPNNWQCCLAVPVAALWLLHLCSACISCTHQFPILLPFIRHLHMAQEQFQMRIAPTFKPKSTRHVLILSLFLSFFLSFFSSLLVTLEAQIPRQEWGSPHTRGRQPILHSQLQRPLLLQSRLQLLLPQLQLQPLWPPFRKRRIRTWTSMDR